jgi:hypothetical protein
MHLRISSISYLSKELSPAPMEAPSLPRSRVYYLTAEEMHFKIMVTLRASRVERLIRAVKREILDAAPIKCVVLHCEFTHPREG